MSSNYIDKKKLKVSKKERMELLENTRTLYVGNLSFYTTEGQIWEVFQRCGEVDEIIMGQNKIDKTPCGFCFIIYNTRQDAENAMRYINNTVLDDRIIHIDWDVGFAEGRQYGRGISGGQKCDDHRKNFDNDRGGVGNILKKKIEKQFGSKLKLFITPLNHREIYNDEVKEIQKQKRGIESETKVTGSEMEEYKFKIEDTENKMEDDKNDITGVESDMAEDECENENEKEEENYELEIDDLVWDEERESDWETEISDSNDSHSTSEQ